MQDYIRQRYGDAAKYGLLQSSPAVVDVSIPDVASLTGVPGEIYCGPDGRMLAGLSLEGDAAFALLDAVGKNVTMKPTLESGAQFEEGEWLICSRSAGTVRPEGTEFTMWATAQAEQRMNVAPIDEDEPCQVNCTLLNFLFTGTEMVHTPTKSERLPIIKGMYFGRAYTLELLPHLQENDDIAELLRKSVIPRLPTATLATCDVPLGDVEAVVEEATMLAHLTSAVCGTMVGLARLEIRQQGQVKQVRFRDPPLIAYNTEAHSWATISARDQPAELTVFLSSCCERARDLWQDYELQRFIGYLCMSTSQRYSEGRIVFAILALELLTAMHLRVTQAVCDEELSKKSLLKKLRWCNTNWKFIQKKYFDDRLRADVRNPLMHMGIVALASAIERFEVFKDLHALATLLLFRVLDYEGKWTDCSDQWAVKAVPWLSSAS